MDERIRRLERAATEQRSATAWADLAAALARAARPAEAYSAAVRASALDPESPARAHLDARLGLDPHGPSLREMHVDWTGLRELGAPRVIRAGTLDGPAFWSGLQMLGENDHVVRRSVHDLGRGVIAFPEEKEQLTAVDILTGEVRWRRPRFLMTAVTGGRAVGATAPDRHGRTSFAAWDPATGLEVARAEARTVDARRLAYGFMVVDETTVVGIAREETEGAGDRLVFVDVPSLAVAGDARLPPGSHEIRCAGGLVFAESFEESIAFDGRGSIRWRSPRGRTASRYDRAPLGLAGGWLFAGSSKTGVQRLGVQDGRPAPLLEWPEKTDGLARVMPSGGLWVFISAPDPIRFIGRGRGPESAARTLVGVDPANGAELWRKDFLEASWVVATADSVLVIAHKEHSRHRHHDAHSVMAVDPCTGEETSRRDLRRAGAFGPPLLVAGRIVLGAKRKGESLVVVDPRGTRSTG